MRQGSTDSVPGKCVSNVDRIHWTSNGQRNAARGPERRLHSDGWWRLSVRRGRAVRTTIQHNATTTQCRLKKPAGGKAKA